MLVAAVLGPEQGEDRELEVVRLPLEQVDDARVLPVGEAEGRVPRFGDLRQVVHSDRRATTALVYPAKSAQIDVDC